MTHPSLSEQQKGITSNAEKITHFLGDPPKMPKKPPLGFSSSSSESAAGLLTGTGAGLGTGLGAITTGLGAGLAATTKPVPGGRGALMGFAEEVAEGLGTAIAVCD